ncbi:MAG: peptidoglycan recognition protein family protein [Treponema sp.]|jgi:N-acetylmuramoyl-L-alanine amidase|nr:peptidoglycan recognition protein family protein [Treponema sp.]
MKITQKHLTLGKPARSGIKFAKKLERIIIHWIGPYPNQVVSTPWQWWENGSDGKGVQASAHFIVKDDDIIQCLPLNEVGWHSGDMRNYDSIGIEVIPMNVAGEFSKTTIETLKLLIQHIRQETGLDLPLKRHFDGVQGKPCPQYYTDFSKVPGGQQRWEELKQILNGGTGDVDEHRRI